MRFRCPHCGTSSVVRTSEVMSATVTWLYVQCRNVDCGHTWRVDAEAAVTISPSAMPRPDVLLPLSPHVRRGLLSEQLQTARVGQHRPQQPWIDDLFDSQDGERGPPAPAMTRP